MSLGLRADIRLGNLEIALSATTEFTSAFDCLSLEIFRLISLKLNHRDLESLACVSRRANSFVISSVYHNEFVPIKKFIKKVINKLDDEENKIIKSSFEKILHSISSLKFVNLLQLKRSILGLQTVLVTKIKALGDKKTDDLKCHLKSSQFINRVFVLIDLKRKIDLVNKYSSKIDQSKEYKELSLEFVKLGEINRAIEVINLIPVESDKICALEEFIHYLGREGKIAQAIFVVKRILNQSVFTPVKDTLIKVCVKTSLLSIHEELLEKNKLDPDNENFNSSEDLIESSIWSISKCLVKLGEIDEAIEVAKQISHMPIRCHAFSSIYKALLQAGRFGLAIDLVNQIKDEELRNEWLKNISMSLAEAGQIDSAIALAKTIKDKTYRSATLLHISSFCD